MTRSIVLFSINSLLLACSLSSFAQDSAVKVQQNIVTLKEVVVRSNLNAPAFIKRVQDDTTFYKAFRNLRVIGYTSLNDIRMMDKKGNVKASLSSRTKQQAAKGCRWMTVLEENTSGDIYDSRHQFNYYTPELYAGLFFARDTICGETNIVAGNTFSTQGKGGIDKHKEQLKMLFFNPGKKIPGIPFIGNKINLFDERIAARYDFLVDMESYKGEMCYVFKITPRTDLSDDDKNEIVINELTTWFRIDTWEIVARVYDLSYKAGVYDFDVHMQAEMTKVGDLLVPKVLQYNGTWNVVFKKRERAVFTATLFDWER